MLNQILRIVFTCEWQTPTRLIKDVMSPKDSRPATRSSVEHIPVLPQNPAKGRQFAIQHAPFKLGPGAEVLFPILLFYALCSFLRSIPDFLFRRVAAIFNGPLGVFHNLVLTRFDHLP